MCNNAPLSVSKTFFFSNTSIQPKSDPKKQQKTYKHLKNTSKLGGGCNNW